MHSQQIEVSIIIPTYNGGSELKNCLRMIFSQRFDLPFEIIAIDSGSTDGTLNVLRSFPVRVEKISSGEFNHGLTRNKGIELARGKYVVMLTQDARPANEHWLKQLLENFDDRSVAGVYCRQMPRNDADVLTKRQLKNGLIGRSKRVVNFIESREQYHALDPIQKLTLCTFDDVCSCIRKSVWNKIPYAKTYFAEDLEWGKKVIKAGYKIIYEPGTAVIHSHDRSAYYEYKRTYLCHRRLFELFRVQTVPTINHALRFSFLNILNDTQYVITEERNKIKRLSLILNIPFLSFAGVFGQYWGAMHEKIGYRFKNFNGV